MGNKFKIYKDCLNIKNTSNKDEFDKFCKKNHSKIENAILKKDD